jgi:hypothetical protein
MIIRNNNRGNCAARADRSSAACRPFQISGSFWRRFCRALRFSERFALIMAIGIALGFRDPSMLFAEEPGKSPSFTLPDAPIPQAPAPTTPQAGNAQPPLDDKEMKKLEQEQAEQEFHEEEHHYILGIFPFFNIVNGSAALPLRPRQKFDLALRRATNPFTFFTTSLIAGVGQAEDKFPGYGQGAEGYGKRFGSHYADVFDADMLGSGLFPVMFHQDPRYHRLGTDGFLKRVCYSVSTTVRTKGDNGKWQPGYSNILGTFAAGGIANLYYPAANRGARLTFERGSVITAERATGALLNEFIPDVQTHFSHRKKPESASTTRP